MLLNVYKVLFVLAWSSGFIAADYLYPEAHTSVILFWRYLLASVSLAVPIVLSKRRTESIRNWCKGRRSALLRAGFVGVVAHTIWLYAVIEAQRFGVSPGANSLINAAQPLLTAALAPVLVGEQTNPRVWVGLVVAFTGVTITVYDGMSAGGSLGAHLIPMVSVAAMTTSVIVERRASSRHTADASRGEPQLSPSVALLVQSTAACLAAGAVMLVVRPDQPELSTRFVGALAWVAYVPSLAAYALLWVVLRRSSAAETSSLFYFSPPATLFMQAVVLGTPIMPSEIAGSLIVAAGVMFAFSSFRWPRRRAAVGSAQAGYSAAT